MSDELLHMRNEDDQISGNKLDLLTLRPHQVLIRLVSTDLICGHSSTADVKLGLDNGKYRWCSWCDRKVHIKSGEVCKYDNTTMKLHLVKRQYKEQILVEMWRCQFHECKFERTVFKDM